MNFTKTPPAIRCGVFFIALISCVSVGCDKEVARTPDWPTGEAPSKLAKKKTKLNNHASTDQSYTLLVYNLYNYLWLERGGAERELRPKPEKEINNLVNIIVEAQPDILAVCEIGTRADLNDLSRRLQKRDLEFPHQYIHLAADPYRRLAVLSKLPLEIHKDAQIQYQMDGKSHRMLRGILDFSIETKRGETRFIGLHLKSKRESKYFDQEQMRRHEAHQVRQHIDKIIEKSPRILLYGDINDTRRSSTVHAISGTQHSPQYLKPLNIDAEDGSRWTHYWKYQEVYSRLDYVFASQAMLDSIIMEESKIIRPKKGRFASDHHPILLKFQ